MTDLEKVRLNGYAIRYIKNPSLEIQLAAVQQNGYAIKYIENPFEEVQLEAVRQDGDAIHYIKDNSIDFIFIDARHDYCGVEEDIRLYWDKLKPGGLLTGHDYLQQNMLTASHEGQRWDICMNNSIRVRSVKGAVDDFIDTHGLRGIATYGDGAPWLSWLVRKPCKPMKPFDFLL